MPRLYLVRHGKAAASFDADLDPGLDALGRAQAAAMTEALAPLGPLALLVSPLKRTRETAAPLEARWRTRGLIEPAVAEIPSPTPDLAARRLWLDQIMAAGWPEAEAGLQAWRLGVIERLLAVREDTVVVSHFIAINVAVGAATGDTRVVAFRPDNCSRTVLDVEDGRQVLGWSWRRPASSRRSRQRPRTRRESRGSIRPSSQSRAVA
jgi:broad specificity phosphatase PhoE